MGRLSRGDEVVELQPVTMQLLCFMAAHPGEVLSHDELLDGVWGETVVSDNVIYWNINQLRKVLQSGEDPEPYIQTLPKRGYRLVARVEDWQEPGHPLRAGRPGLRLWLPVAAVLLMVAVAWLFREPSPPILENQGLPTLAVLPFVNLGDTEADDAFADGFTEELLNMVSQLSELRVIARTSSFYYKNRNTDLREVGETLGASHLVEGSVRRSKDRMRITVQLIDAPTGHHRWSQTYDRRLVDALDVQQDVAEQVARALGIQLATGEVALLREPSDVDADAVALYEQAQAMTRNRSPRGPEQFDELHELLNRALEKQPDYLPALYMLGFSYAMLRSIYSLSFEESVGPARAVLVRMLDHGYENTGEYQLLNAIVMRHEMSSWGVTEARIQSINDAYERAIELRPNDTNPILSYAIHARRLGDLEKAGRLLGQAALLDPLDVGVNLQLARVLSATGNREEAVNRARALTVHHPEFPVSYVTTAEILSSYGAFDEALEWLNKAPRQEGSNLVSYQFRLTHFAMGDIDGAVDWIYRSGITPEEEALVVGLRGNWATAAADLDALLRNNPAPESWQRVWAGDAAFLASSFEAARFYYESAAPGLHDPAAPSLNQQNYRVAIKLAATLQQIGEVERADVLLDSLEQWLTSRHRLGFEGYTVSMAEVLVLQDRREEAIEELRSLFEQGWTQLSGTYSDGWYGQTSPILSRLAGEAAFAELLTLSQQNLSQMRAQAGAGP